MKLITIANNGEEAVRLSLENEFDAVLMDINMPLMDGFAATAAIRSHAGLKALPIIAMTAHAVSGYREKCITAGMNDYITKPLKPNTLFSVFVEWIK